MVLQLIWNIRWRLILNVIPLFPTGFKVNWVSPQEWWKNGTYLKTAYMDWVMVGVKVGQYSTPESYGYISGPFHKGNFLISWIKPEAELTWLHHPSNLLHGYSELCTQYLDMTWQGTTEVTTTRPSLNEDLRRSTIFTSIYTSKYSWTIQSCSDLHYFGAKSRVSNRKRSGSHQSLEALRNSSIKLGDPSVWMVFPPCCLFHLFWVLLFFKVSILSCTRCPC